jgi:putative transposase
MPVTLFRGQTSPYTTENAAVTIAAIGVKSLLLTFHSDGDKDSAMSRPLRIQYPHAYYHVTCRGNERREIFRRPEDRKDFFRLLARSLDIFEVRLLVYALMHNHFHVLVCTPKGNLSEFMRHFNISYTVAFNRRRRRSGHLYQGRYKAFLIDENSYLLEVSRYIYLNPLRIKSNKPLQERWQDLMRNDSTSFPGYLHQKNRKSFVYYKTILDYFGPAGGKSVQDYKKYVAEGVEKDIPNPLNKGKGTGIVGAATPPWLAIGVNQNTLEWYA